MYLLVIALPFVRNHIPSRLLLQAVDVIKLQEAALGAELRDGYGFCRGGVYCTSTIIIIKILSSLYTQMTSRLPSALSRVY